jgi:hypothetical protein
MNWKKKIREQLKQAASQRKIGAPLKKLAKLLLDGDTPFVLVYSSSRDYYYDLRFSEKLSKYTSMLILKNGYKVFFLNRK